MSYEEQVRRRKEENWRVLKELGVLAAKNDLADSISRNPRFAGNSIKKVYKPRRKPENLPTPSRKSTRLLGKEAPKYAEIDGGLDPPPRRCSSSQKSSPRVKRENSFGAIPGVPVGTVYGTRMEASHDGIHRPTVAGIHGNPALGCYSIALSGGYEDDVDLGSSFIYTGEGGRDLKGTKANPKNLRTAAQSKDQVLERGNLALTKNVEDNLPVRVLRGYKLNSNFAPEEGYRYDGLYRVTKYYNAVGKSGYTVFKFQFERIEDQEPAPWSNEVEMEENMPGHNVQPNDENTDVSSNIHDEEPEKDNV